MWEKIKRFCLLTDEVHAREREKLRQAMKEFDGKEPATEEEFEDLFMLRRAPKSRGSGDPSSLERWLKHPPSNA
jgi:hypothetical protein